jgi:hypothetical protein
LICFSASVVISSGDSVSLFMPIHSIGRASASCLLTIGSRMSSGRAPRTLATRSRTSCAATSIGRDRLNSMVMLLTCSRLSLVSVLIPSTVLITSSSRSVTSVSTTPAAAPG